MDDPPQFLRTGVPDSAPRRWAVYRLATADAARPEATIVVEVTGRGNAPENAASPEDLIERLDLDQELRSVVAFADKAFSALKVLRPSELGVEFGVELGGKLGIPLVTMGEAKANLKVTLKWDGSQGKEGG